jgi:ribosomal protein S18 acetylase RimI-like enzyme
MNAGAVIGSNGFAVQRSGWRDLLRVWRVQRAIFLEDAYDPFTLLGLALNPAGLRLHAVQNDDVVGFLACETSLRDGAAWIVMVGTHPRFWGRGIASALIGAAEREMARRASRMKLTVRRGNTRAIALYERLGYQHISTTRRYYNDGEDGLIMEKSLRGPRMEV